MPQQKSHPVVWTGQVVFEFGRVRCNFSLLACSMGKGPGKPSMHVHNKTTDLNYLWNLPHYMYKFEKALQYVAQFSYTLVCNRYIFSSIRRKFLRFLLEVGHLLTFNSYRDLPLGRCIFTIMLFSPKPLSCPVYVPLAQFSYIHKTRFFPKILDANWCVSHSAACFSCFLFDLWIEIGLASIVWCAKWGVDVELILQCWFFNPPLLGGFSYTQSTVSYVIYCLGKGS